MFAKGPPSITQLFKNNNSKNTIINVFNVDLHHNPIKVQVQESSNTKSLYKKHTNFLQE